MTKRNHFLFFAVLLTVNLFLASFLVSISVYTANFFDEVFTVIIFAACAVSFIVTAVGTVLAFVKNNNIVLAVGTGLSAVTAAICFFGAAYESIDGGICGFIITVALCVGFYMGFSPFRIKDASGNKKLFLLFTVITSICVFTQQFYAYFDYSYGGYNYGGIDIFNCYYSLPVTLIWLVSLFLRDKDFFGYYCDGAVGVAGVMAITEIWVTYEKYSSVIYFNIARTVIIVCVLTVFYLMHYKFFKHLNAEEGAEVKIALNSTDNSVNYGKLADLYKLYQNGILTEAEYQYEKNLILGSTTKEEESNVF